MKKNILGNHFKNLREQHGMSQPVLAEQLSVSNAFINFLELGKRLPSKGTLARFSRFFNVEITHLNDLLEKQKLLNKEDESEVVEGLPDSIQELNNLLTKVDKPLLDELVTSFMNQVNEHLIKVTPNYNLSDLRDKYKSTLSFKHEQSEVICIEGFLKMPEKTQMFFKFVRKESSLILELLQNDRSKIEMFEKWIGPHVYSNLCDVEVPQIAETQRGVSFTWFAPSVTLDQQYQFLLEQKEINIDLVLFNSGQLAWHIQTQESDIG